MNYFKFIENCYVAQKRIYHSKCIMYTWKNLYSTLVGAQCSSYLSCPYWFSIHLFYEILRKRCWNYVCVCFSLDFYQFLSHIFRCSAVRLIRSRDCFVFLRELTPLSLCNVHLYLLIFLAVKSALSEITIATPAFFD